MENAGKVAAHALWLLLLDRRDWGTAPGTPPAPSSARLVPLGTWMDNVPKVRQPFGNFVEREAAGVPVYKTSLPGRPDGQYVSVMFPPAVRKAEWSRKS